MIRLGIRYFVRGLLFLFPIVGLIWLFDAVADFGNRLFPNLPVLLGAILLIGLVVGVGYGGSRILAFLLRSRVGKITEKIPLLSLPVKAVETFYKMGVRAMVAFDQPVLVPGNSPDERRIGFVVRNSAKSIGKTDYVPVYLPAPFSFFGDLVLLPKDKIEPVTDVSRDEVLDFLISGGISDSRD